MGDSAGELTVDFNGRDLNLLGLLNRVETQLLKAEQTGRRTGQGIGQGVGSGAAQADRAVLQYANSLANVQRAQGDLKGSVDTLRNALGQLTPNTLEANQAMVRLAQAEKQLDASTRTTGGMLDSFKQGLIGFAAPAAVAGATIQAVTSAIKSFGDALQMKAALDTTTASINMQMKGVRDMTVTWAEARSVGQQYNLTQQEQAAILQNSIVVLKNSKAGADELMTTLLRLQATSPDQPIEEAARALRELASGDVNTIKELFNINAKNALAMKNEIAAGGDAVAVLSRYLTDAGAGMDLLALRAQGVNGAMAELKVAQEDMALAQAEWAQGPGLAIMTEKINVIRGATRLLSADWDSMAASAENAGQNGGWAVTLLSGIVPNLQQALSGANEAFALLGLTTAEATDAAVTNAVAVGANVVAQTAEEQAVAAASAEVEKQTLALIDNLTKKQQAAIEGQKLASVQATLANLGNLVADGILTDAAAAAQLEKMYGFATAAALQLVAAQAAIAGGSGVGPAPRGGPSDADEIRGAQHADRQAQLKARQDAAAGAAKAEERYQQALGNNAPAIARVKAELQGLKVGTEAYYEKLTELTRLQQAQDRAASKGGGGKVAGQAKTNEKLLRDQEKANEKYAEAEKDHTENLLDIQEEYADKRREAEDNLRQSLLDGGASFYDTLINMEDQNAAKAADAQYQAFLANDLPAIAAEKGADVAEAYQDAYEKVLLDRAKRQAAIEKARSEGDTAKAEALAGVDEKYRAAEDARLAKIKEGNDSLRAEEERRIAEENARFEEQTGKEIDSQDRVAKASDAAAERKVANSERSATAIAAEQAALNKLADTYDKVAPTGAQAAGPQATAGQSPSTAAATTDLGTILEGLKAVIASVEAAVRASGQSVEQATNKAGDKVAGAVRDLRSDGGGIR